MKTPSIKKLAIAALLMAAGTQGALAVPLLNGFGGDRNYGDLAMLANDDGSSNLINLPFNINFFGNNYSQFYINNNGNITFNAPVGQYTPDAFPISNQPMIAPRMETTTTSATVIFQLMIPSTAMLVMTAAPGGIVVQVRDCSMLHDAFAALVMRPASAPGN